MTFDYNELVEYLKGKGAIPMVIIYAQNPASEGAEVMIDYLTTPAWDDADAQLKADTQKAVAAVADEIK